MIEPRQVSLAEILLGLGRHYYTLSNYGVSAERSVGCPVSVQYEISSMHRVFSAYRWGLRHPVMIIEGMKLMRPRPLCLLQSAVMALLRCDCVF